MTEQQYDGAQHEERTVRRAFEDALGYRLRDGAASFNVARGASGVAITVGRRDNHFGYVGIGINFDAALTDLLESVR